MGWLGPLTAFVIFAAVVVALVMWLGGFVKLLVTELYRYQKWERHGLCPDCHNPVSRVESRPVDQMYGPSRITQTVCGCGHRGTQSGNRRFAEW